MRTAIWIIMQWNQMEKIEVTHENINTVEDIYWNTSSNPSKSVEKCMLGTEVISLNSSAVPRLIHVVGLYFTSQRFAVELSST